MRAKIIAVSTACVLAAIMLCAAFFITHHQPSAHALQKQGAVPAAAQSAPADSSSLFPGLKSMHVTSLSISTPERSFQFHMDTQGTVSVNGQQADSEIFSTLLEQIETLPVEHRSAFSPQPKDLILTLVISSGQEEQTARFYEDGGAGKNTHIVLGSDDAPEYRQTSGWRVGTLMMTCEGTRILDMHGNETPANK